MVIDKTEKVLLSLNKNEVNNIKKIKKYATRYTNGVLSICLDHFVRKHYDEYKCLDAIEILLKLGVNPNDCILSDDNFIQIAIRSGYSSEFVLSVINLALKHNLNVNHVNKYGITIIQTAIEKELNIECIIEIFRLFLKHNFNPILKEKALKSFLYLSERQNRKIEEFLEYIDGDLKIGNENCANMDNVIETFPSKIASDMEKYGKILNKRQYKFTPTIGREKELENLILSLAQDKKCPILVGESGVGKSSVVYELSYRINNKFVPKFLQNTLIFELDVNGIVAGTKYRGDFEENIKKVLDCCIMYNIILFIDEIHTIYGAGSSIENPNDLASIIKMYIDKEGLKVIGTTTNEEYNNYFVKDALKRRFDKIAVKEPEKDMLSKIIIKILNDYSVKNGISSEMILNNYIEIVEILIELTNRNHRSYNDNINNPDLVISIIDKSFAYAKVNECEILSIEHFIKSIKLCDRLYDSAKEKTIKKLEIIIESKEKDFQKIIKFKTNENKHYN